MLRFTLAENTESIQTLIPNISPQSIPKSSSITNIKDPGRIEFYGMGIFTDLMNIRNLARNDIFTFLFSLGYTFEFFEDFNPFTIQQELIDRQVSAVIVNEDVIGSPKCLFLFGPGLQNIKGIMLSSLWMDKTFRSFWFSRDVKHVFPPGVSPLELVNAIGIGEPPVQQARFELDLEVDFKQVRLARDDYTKYAVSVPEPVTYEVSLSVQGIPALSRCEPIPNSGVPPFQGYLKTNIGVNTVDGIHVVSLVGNGGGYTISDTITYQTL